MSLTREPPTLARAACPLCGHGRHGRSWLGGVRYRGKEYDYRACQACGSLFCDPMPDAEALAEMYGPAYETHSPGDPSLADPKEPGRVLGWLRRLGRGTFLDYGCGTGDLLARARALGWEAVGVELDPAVAAAVGRRTGATVVSDPDRLYAERGAFADALHLGDVIEHLTALDRQMPEILRLLRPGGLLLAQGPLEANANLFTLALRVARRVRGNRPAERAPYHVLLATAAGQRTLFQRLGLAEREYVVREVCWPAPARLGLRQLANPRAVGLFAVRRLSQAVSLLRPGRWGNRYFYAGHRPA